MEVSRSRMKNFAAGSDDKGAKIFSRIYDDEKVNEGNYRGNLKDWVSTIGDGGMGCCIDLAWREACVVVKV